MSNILTFKELNSSQPKVKLKFILPNEDSLPVVKEFKFILPNEDSLPTNKEFKFILPNELLNLIILNGYFPKKTRRNIIKKFYKKKTQKYIFKTRLRMIHSYIIIKELNQNYYQLLNQLDIRRKYIEYFTILKYDSSFITFLFFNRIHRQIYKGPSLINHDNSYLSKNKKLKVKNFLNMFNGKEGKIKHVNYVMFTHNGKWRNPYDKNGKLISPHWIYFKYDPDFTIYHWNAHSIRNGQPYRLCMYGVISNKYDNQIDLMKKYWEHFDFNGVHRIDYYDKDGKKNDSVFYYTHDN